MRKNTSDKKFVNVMVSHNYKQFKMLKGNRNLNLQNLNRILESMETGQLVSPIIVNGKMQIIDGQHRFTAQKELGLPIYYIMMEGYALPEVQKLNTNGSNWGKKQYLESYCVLGKKEYLRFKDFMETFPEFTLNTCYSLLTKSQDSSANKKTSVTDENGKRITKYRKWFENGDFEVKDWDFAVDAAQKIKMVAPYYHGYNRRSFVVTMIGLFQNEEYNHAEFLQKLAFQSVSLQDCNDVNQYKILIEEIYNYKRRKKVNLRFAA